MHQSVQKLLKAPPKAASLITTKGKGKDESDAKSQITKVPIDEMDSIGVRLSPTFERDSIESVTLKSFRKMVGYDTFNTILKKDLAESQDRSDYYNVTVSFMVKRQSADAQTIPDPIQIDGKNLAAMLEKGFPYDDVEFNANERAQ